jgi:hypothetical protein
MSAPAPERTLTTALLNYEAGGYRNDGSFDLGPLATAFADLPKAPALFVLNEAKNWHRDGLGPALQAAQLLSMTWGRPYEVRLSPTHAGIPTALFYDPSRLTLRYSGTDTEWPDKWGVLRFLPRAAEQGAQLIQVLGDQWLHSSREQRYQRAQQMDHLAGSAYPTAMIGDLNGTASGPHLPARDWTQARYVSATHRAVQNPDGTWTDDTRAVDHLIGRWDNGRRVDGAGMHSAAELDVLRHGADAAHAFLPTVNDGIDAGGGQLIDWVLLNNAWLHNGGGVAPHTYRVHVPRSAPPSDHRMVSVDLVLPQAELP